MIEAYSEGRKDWPIKKPLMEQPKPDASLGTASKSIPTEKSPVFILKPQAWGVGIDLNEAGRRTPVAIIASDMPRTSRDVA